MVSRVGENVQSETVGQWGASERDAARDSGGDPRVEALGRAVARARHELDAYEAHLSDRAEAERELGVLDAAVRSAAPEVAELRQSLLLLTAAVGSVSALTGALAEVRKAIEIFGTPAPR